MNNGASCCIPMFKNGSTPSPCNRDIVWRINGLGAMCMFHFERYVTTHEVDIKHIERLSDDERDFVVRCEPGKGHQGHRGHHRAQRV